jgi:hypothetical protein
MIAFAILSFIPTALSNFTRNFGNSAIETANPSGALVTNADIATHAGQPVTLAVIVSIDRDALVTGANGCIGDASGGNDCLRVAGRSEENAGLRRGASGATTCKLKAEVDRRQLLRVQQR